MPTRLRRRCPPVWARGRSAWRNCSPQSDLITIHVPLNDATRNMVNADSLALMKPTAWLVNTCRGEVVDETALHAALERRQIAGAALDVLVQEPPPPDHPLLSLDNVIFTPPHGRGHLRLLLPAGRVHLQQH